MIKNVPKYCYESDYGNRYYFIYNDEIYFYGNEIDWNTETTTHTLYKMNLDGTNKKVFAESNELDNPMFYFVYKNEAYFHLGGPAQNNPETGKIVNKKINLTTGDITNVNCDEFLLPYSLKDGKVKAYYNVRNLRTLYYASMEEMFNNGEVYWGIFDLDNDKMTFEKSIAIENSDLVTDSFFDFDIEDIYFASDDANIRDCKIYKNDEVLYEFENKPSILAKNGNYLYIYDYYNIYKLNINTKQIEKEEKHYVKDLKRIKSYNNELNYFSGASFTYVFDFETEKLDFIILSASDLFTNVFKIKDNLIFVTNTENIKYRDDNIENRGTVCIVDDEHSSIGDGFEYVRKLSFDENYMYILNESNDEKYEVSKVEIK